MLQGIYKAAGTANEYTWYVSTEDRRIDTSVTTAHIQFLVKFTNDMDKRVVYAYPTKLGIYDRYTTMTFIHNTTENFLTAKVNFVPNGYWYYEIYEVSWIGTITLTSASAPERTSPFSPTNQSKFPSFASISSSRENLIDLGILPIVALDLFNG